MPTLAELAALHAMAAQEREARLPPVEHDPTGRAPSASELPGKYAALGDEIGRLVDAKQVAYGDSFGRSGAVLRELYPRGIAPDQYDDMLSLVRIIDKLFRIANQRDAFGESPYRDIAGYGLLGAARSETSAPVGTADEPRDPVSPDTAAHGPI